VGKVLSKMLAGIGANVYCEARKTSDLSLVTAMGYTPVYLDDLDNKLPDMDVIFNTIPVTILNSKRLDLLKEETLVIDLASSPGGVDFKYAKENKKNVQWALALPAKVAPKTAAMYVKKEIDEIFEEIKIEKINNEKS